MRSLWDHWNQSFSNFIVHKNDLGIWLHYKFQFKRSGVVPEIKLQEMMSDREAWHAAAHGIAKASDTSGQLNKNDNPKSTALTSSPLMSNSSPRRMLPAHRAHFVSAEHLDFPFQQFGKPKALKASPLLEQYGGSWINKNRATIWPCNPTPGHISREKQDQIGYMHPQCFL